MQPINEDEFAYEIEQCAKDCFEGKVERTGNVITFVLPSGKTFEAQIREK